MKIAACPECGVDVVQCDNSVFLDHPAVTYDEAKSPWTIMWGNFASVGDPSPDGKGHALHEHQPQDSVMA